MTMGTRTYRCPVDDDLRPVARARATQMLVSVYEVIAPDGCESILDEWTESLRHDPDPEMAALNAADEKYDELKEAGV